MKQLIKNTLTAAKKLFLTGVCFLVAAPLTGIGTFAVRPAPAQSQDSPKPSFDVVSIKPSDCRPPGSQGSYYIYRFQPGRFTGCMSLKNFISKAYEIDDIEPEISGGPDWIDSDYFSIEAKAEGVTDWSTLRLMVQSLLEEKFRLKIHFETRQQPVYSLVVAKGGHKLKEAADENGDNTDSMPRRGISVSVNADTGRREIVAYAVTMEKFAEKALRKSMDRNVVDKTGLKGHYDIELHTALDPLSDPRSRSGIMQPAPSGPTDPIPSAELSAPSIFTAIKEQLGLELKSDKAPLECIVVDSAEKPSEN